MGHRQATELAIAMTNRDVGRGNRPLPTLCVTGRKGRPKPLSIRACVGFYPRMVEKGLTLIMLSGAPDNMIYPECLFIQSSLHFS